MRRIRPTLGAATLLASLLAAPAAFAGDEVKAVDIASKMTGVVDELGKKQTGTPVQGEQKAIVRDLDELIASLEKQCEQCRGGLKRNNPRSGMRDSMISSGNGEMGPLVNPGDGGKDWGQLTPRERDRILQSMTEGFPPEYRTVLERYYRRLADEKTGSAGAKAKPAEAAGGSAAKP
jgi:hypothetical protein